MLSLIVACSKEKRVIGKDGKIPWDLPDDRKNFKKITMGNILIMGRKTYESIGHPLEGRVVIVLSNTKNFLVEGSLYTVRNLEAAFRLAEQMQKQVRANEIIICGGQSIYEDTIDKVDKIYLAEVESDVEGDTFFPEFNRDNFVLLGIDPGEGEIPHKFLTFGRC